MTADDSTDPTTLSVSSMTPTRMRALLLAALDSPTQGGVHVDGAAGASQLLAGLGQRVGARGEGLHERAMTPTASVPDLVRIKEAAKVLLARAERREDRDAATLLYLVAAAAALGRYGIEISSSPVEEQRERYESLATHHTGFALGDLFRRAADRIHKRDGSS